MIDLGVSKLMIIGVVALIVIGPEKLPGVARMAGMLLGRAQKYVGDLKSEMAQQMQIDELNEMRKTVKDAAQSVQDSLKKAESSVAKNVSETTKDLEATFNQSLPSTTELSTNSEALSALEKPQREFDEVSLAQQQRQAKRVAAPTKTWGEAASKTESAKTEGDPKSSWRARRSSTPMWYKRRARKKGALLSGAGRQEQVRLTKHESNAKQ